MAHPHGHHRMPGYDPLGRGMLATWWNLCREVREKQILRRGFLTASILHHQKREGGRKEGGWKEGQAKTQRIQLQHFEEHAVETTKEEKTGKMAKRDQTEDRLLHCQEL